LPGSSALLLVILVFASFFTVGQNELTVVNRFGEYRYVAGPGLHFKVPLIDGTQAYRTDIRAMSPEKGVNTYTIDNQEVDVVYTAFYRVPADRVAYIFTNNRDYESRLAAMTVDRLKAAMGQVNVQSVAEKRGELRDAIKATLDHDVKLLGVEITDFQVTDMQYTDAFRQAVNNAAVQKANIESLQYQRQQAQEAGRDSQDQGGRRRQCGARAGQGCSRRSAIAGAGGSKSHRITGGSPDGGNPCAGGCAEKQPDPDRPAQSGTLGRQIAGGDLCRCTYPVAAGGQADGGTRGDGCWYRSAPIE
jgi:regulator of protease activity HflC (stomatin/prohibitin superfamily)